MKKLPKLSFGDKIGIVSIADNLEQEKIISTKFDTVKRIFEQHLGYKMIFGKNIYLPIQGIHPSKRVEDFNSFIKDSNIKMIWPIGGGAFTNEILPYIDWEALLNNPKIICGYSDITALNNAIFTKTGLTNFSGPTPGSLGPFTYGSLETFLYFKNTVLEQNSSELNFHKYYYDYTANIETYPEQIVNDDGLKIIKHGKSNGIIVGGNISTFCLLIGTDFIPDFENKVLFLEECSESNIGIIRRQLMHIKNQKNFNKISGIVFGRVNKECLKYYDIDLETTINDFVDGLDIPVVMNAQFGHIYPIQTIPIGGNIEIDTNKGIYKMNL
ncbi:S66 peptidase family protein [Candidatus Vampirococcus lugosii]|uniref:Muramoyltetrapeptide carboxypeptidase n=1 Tax=Candidatus Vampirococcus lugosii TaxID=2789015 RepID=A0ABS5QJW5_9BACT|nr:S66 peptidase family protein [Candidatus Vampirococcus lugosii]MBS8121454.1 muramoyltetrapeptide carboxypeptidase [Candidatus Vampirococcus lugosii]